LRARPLLKRRKVCSFCRSGSDSINPLDVRALGHYIDSRARIKNRRRTGTCAKHQRKLSRAIKKAREMALLPYK
jgi:small subunit ribosomal protein S18